MDVKVNYWLPEALYERLRREAYESHESASAIVREALEVRLAEREALRKVE